MTQVQYLKCEQCSVESKDVDQWFTLRVSHSRHGNPQIFCSVEFVILRGATRIFSDRDEAHFCSLACFTAKLGANP
jgi:hypothetical protein